MTRTIKVTLCAACLCAVAFVFNPTSAQSAAEPPVDRLEYATLRWAGRENTHVIRPNGEVEFIGSQLTSLRKPNRADDRSFYMNIALNALAKEGFELVAITSDDYVLKRRATASPQPK